MTPNPGDHVLAALIVAYPLYFTLDWSWRGRARLETGEARARLRFYRQSLVELWLLTPAVLVWWFWSGRTITQIGLGVPGGWAFWIGAVVVAALAAALGRQVAVVRTSAVARAQVQGQFRGVTGLLIPRDSHERRIWIGLSVTAGFCEEVLFRAFLIWYLATWLPVAAAVLVSAVVFGVGHLYLGWGVGVLRATVMGVIFGAAYLVTGTLWVPIALHTAVDIVSGLTGSVALEEDASVNAGESPEVEAGPSSP
jgi:membrane protease YdiL (CAAX protease family)